MKYDYTPEEEKRNGNIILIVLLIHIIAFTLGAVHAKAQIGCSRQDILCADSLFIEVIDYPNLVYTKMDTATIVVFNLDHNYCTSVTVFSNNRTDNYIELIRKFEHCNYLGFNSSIRYDTNTSFIFKLQKE